MELGYWNCRGLAHPIRLLLAYTKTPYQEAVYECGEAPGYDRSEWTEVKDHMDLDFPNLPYLIDGCLRITQSNAILRHLGRKFGLLGRSDEEQAMCDMVGDVAQDFRNKLVRLCYNPAFDTEVLAFMASLPDALQSFEDRVHSQWFAGEVVTWCDFVMYELLDQTRLLCAVQKRRIFRNFPALNEFMQRFEALPDIEAYMQSEKWYSWPINNKMAQFGAGPVPTELQSLCA